LIRISFIFIKDEQLRELPLRILQPFSEVGIELAEQVAFLLRIFAVVSVQQSLIEA